MKRGDVILIGREWICIYHDCLFFGYRFQLEKLFAPLPSARASPSSRISPSPVLHRLRGIAEIPFLIVVADFFNAVRDVAGDGRIQQFQVQIVPVEEGEKEAATFASWDTEANVRSVHYFIVSYA